MKRKVSIFLNQCLPLSEVFIAQQARAFRRYDPLIVACRKARHAISTNLPEIILNKNNSLAEKIQENIFKLTKRNNFLKSQIKASDIVHAHFGPAGWLTSNIARTVHKPLVVTLHGFDVLKSDISLRRDGYLQSDFAQHRAKLAQRASAFMCVSDYVRKRAIDFGFPAEKCHLHYMGIPIPLLKEKAPQMLDQAFRLLAVGRLVPFKGHRFLIESVRLLQEAGYNIHLDIVGDGPLRQELEKQAAQIIRNYTFHGPLPHDRVLDLMHESDLFCHSAIKMPNGQTEAFGLVLLEAQAVGLPVVAFDSGGIPEALQNGRTGMLSPEKDINTYAAHIAALIDNPHLYQNMARTAPLFVKENFDIEAHTNHLENIFDELIIQKAAS